MSFVDKLKNWAIRPTSISATSTPPKTAPEEPKPTLLFLDKRGRVIQGGWSSICWEVAPGKFVGLVFPDDCAELDEEWETLTQLTNLIKEIVLPGMAKKYIRDRSKE